MEANMEIFYFLISTEYLLFTISLGLALLLAIAVMLIGEFDDELDFDIEDAPVLNFLGFGHVPVMVGILTLLTSFGIFGYIIQGILAAKLFLLPWFIAVIPAAVFSVFATSKMNKIIGELLPSYENYSINLSNLVGKEATITLPAPAGRIVEAKVIDDLHQIHYIRLKITHDVFMGDKLILSVLDQDTNVFTHN